MTKVRELMIILICLSILLGSLWFWLYLRPANQRAEELRTTIAARIERLQDEEDQAMQRRVVYADLTAELEIRMAEWEVASVDLPESFVDTEVLRHVQENFYRHTPAVSLGFNHSHRRPGDELYSTVVSLAFNTSYWQLRAILYHLLEEDALGNRVISYSIGIAPMLPEDFLDSVIGVAEYIPEHIREEFVADFHAYHAGAEDVQFDGLYMLSVSMDVEYLSLTPGMLPEVQIRTILTR